MHEMSLAESMLEIVETTARKAGGTRVVNVRLQIGTLSHVATDALRFCFGAVTRGSLAEGATLDIEDVPGEAWCMPCGANVPLVQVGDPCPRCGSYQLAVTSGDTMRVKDIAIA
jgi:hydrogenase nickel incorporation protein HypA/HybF